MAVNFRLAYNQGIDYVDLFPRSNVQAIIGADDILQYSTINVTIPAPSDNPNTQTIAITTTEAQVNAPVNMFLVSTGAQAQNDYGTIDQFEVQENSLVITRLYNWPSDSIEVMLVFQQKGAQ